MAITDTVVANELFWTNLGAENAYNTFATRTKAVGKLQAFVVFIFGFFSTGGFLCFFFKREDFNSCSMVWLGIGFGLLIAGYFLSVESDMPSVHKVDLNEVASIQKEFSDAVRTSNDWFRAAGIVVGFGTLCIAIGLLYQFAKGPDKPAGPPPAPPIPVRLKAAAQLRDKQVLVTYTVRAEKNTCVNVLLTGSDSLQKDGNVLYRDQALLYRSGQTDSTGQLMDFYPLSDTFKGRFVKVAAWLCKKPSGPEENDVVLQKVIDLQRK
jgi:hypothetical protein